MVKPSKEDATPRKDGWLERVGTWAEVTVGSLLAGRNRTDVWEVVETRNPEKIEFGHTGWFKMVNRVNGQVFSCEPKNRTYPVTFLMETDVEEPPPAQPHADADQIALLVRELGATEIATMNNETGEVACPDYDGTFHKNTQMSQGDEYWMHLEIAHGMDTTGLRALPNEEMVVARIKAHGNAHNPLKPTTGGGFPHRHVPERHGFKQDGDWS